MGEQSAELDFFISALYQSEVCIPDGLDQADPCLLWNGEAEDLRVNLADNVGPRQPIFDEEVSKLVPRFEEVAFQSMIQHLVDIGRSGFSHYLVDGLLRDSLRHGRGCLEDVDCLSKVPLGYLYNGFQTPFGSLHILIFRDSVKVFNDFFLGERREPE